MLRLSGMENSTPGAFVQYQGGMGLLRRCSRALAPCLVLATVGTLLLASACKGPIDPCSVCNKSTTYCLVHMGSPNWDPQTVCKPIPQGCTSGASCDCIIKADFMATSPPQCTTSIGIVKITPGNDC